MKIDDYVIWTECVDRWRCSERWGRIVNISSAGTLKVELFNDPDNPKTFKLRKQGGYKGLRLATETEIAQRRWRKAKPVSKHLSIQQYQALYSGNWYVHLSDEVSRHAANPATLREVAAEIAAIAEWLEKEPK